MGGDVHVLLRRFIRASRGRMTRQRRQIADAFLALDRHVRPEELYELLRAHAAGRRVPARATVYRTLKLLRAAGLADAVSLDDGATRFERAADRRHHDHLRCTACGCLVEFMDERIERLQRAIVRKHGFVPTGHRMEIFGLCPRCARRRRAGAGKGRSS